MTSLQLGIITPSTLLDLACFKCDRNNTHTRVLNIIHFIIKTFTIAHVPYLDELETSRVQARPSDKETFQHRRVYLRKWLVKAKLSRDKLFLLRCCHETCSGELYVLPNLEATSVLRNFLLLLMYSLKRGRRLF